MRATSRLRTDRDWRGLDPAMARRTAADINAERARGELPGPPTLTGGQLLAARVLRSVARRLVETATPVAPDGAPEEAGKVDARGAGRRRAPSKALVDRLVLELLGDDPATPSVRDLLEPAGSTDDLAPAARALLRDLPRATPESLVGRLLWIRDHWPHLLEPRDEVEPLLLLAADLVAEEARALQLRYRPPTGDRAHGQAADGADDADDADTIAALGFGGHGAGTGPDYAGLDAEPERFSVDTAWMADVVLQAKATYVWLDQLSRRHGRDIRTLDAIPDEELARLASWGVTGLWLIGVWQRSHASAEIKHRRGNPDAVASAYALDEYRIADDLGGEPALERLRERAASHGIRLASDMVPNHMGIDSTWVINHPERFLAIAESPFPSYSFTGPDLAQHPDVEIRLEDHYWDATDAAVVFQRTDRRSGERRYVYHGNDGTSFPWNDTAQLDYLRADVREVVIRTIVDVARRFPIIRFDAAMVLARRHIRRLWWPEPGGGGGIPSRAEHAISSRAFAAAMPREFWREVVDRVAAEVPGTLLLAEAFWLMEGFFVRTLGMHRVYNSAFMHMLRDENGEGYRRVIKETLAFDPQVLGRFVNFMTNPDEATALEQFGADDKYFGVAVVLATMPGLPMLGHGQLEGLGERYGMEFRRPMRDEQPNARLLARHQRELVPLLRQRHRFAGAADFRLYDLVTEDGGVDEHVYAYSNGTGPDRSLVLYHDRFASAAGRIRGSAAYAVVDAAGNHGPRTSTLAEALGLEGDSARTVTFHDPRTGATLASTIGEIQDQGLAIHLDAYEHHAYTEIKVGDS